MSAPAPSPNRHDSWPTAPAGAAAVLEVVHSLLTLAPPALAAFVAWGPPLVCCVGLSSMVHAALSPVLSTPAHAALVLLAACFSATPLTFLNYGAVIHGVPLQRILACASALALGSDFHVGRPWCETLTLVTTLGLCPAMGPAPPPLQTAAFAVLLIRAGASPAFPGGAADDEAAARPPAVPQGPAAAQPPADAPGPAADPMAVDAAHTPPPPEWGVDVMGHRRACACYGPSCREPFSKGDLRAYRPRQTGTHRQYFHPGCVEGGLGPVEEVEGAAALQPELLEELRPHCDQPGRPTRDEFLAAQRAKRRRTLAVPPARSGAARNRRPDDGDDEAIDGQETQADPDTGAQILINLGWWDGVSYDDLSTDVRTLGRVPGPLTHSLALLRGAVATAFLSAVESGDVAAAERAGKFLTLRASPPARPELIASFLEASWRLS